MQYSNAFKGNSSTLAKTARTIGSIKTLDLTKDGFYSFLTTAENTTEVVLTQSRTPGRPSIDPRTVNALAMNTFKSSATMMYADTRGIYLEYWSPDIDYRQNFTLHVKWNELGVEEPNESHFQTFLDFVKWGILEKYFLLILLKHNKCRKAILKALDNISMAMHERYHVGKGYYLETHIEGGWDLSSPIGVVRSNVCLEEIGIKCIVRDNVVKLKN